MLSFRVRDWDCEELGEALGRRGIALRAGLHCAPLAHRTAGTLESGTLRASVSAFTVPEEIGPGAGHHGGTAERRSRVRWEELSGQPDAPRGGRLAVFLSGWGSAGPAPSFLPEEQTECL